MRRIWSESTLTGRNFGWAPEQHAQAVAHIARVIREDNGTKPKFDDVVNFYVRSAELARQGKLRNAPIEFAGMSLSAADLDALVAFLKSLTEDYDDA